MIQEYIRNILCIKDLFEPFVEIDATPAKDTNEFRINYYTPHLI